VQEHLVWHLLVINFPNCGWSEKSAKSLTTCCPEDGGSMFFQNTGRLYITVEKAIIFIATNVV
jgi:hypothetical protein